jgi:drug/metabolite transporter (DMT)-like permease
MSVTARGFVLAAVSGGVTSGVGYAIWYRALRGLSATQAGIVQLSVPVIAAGGAVAFLGESVSPRLAVSGAAVIGGLALVLSDRARPRPA